MSRKSKNSSSLHVLLKSAVVLFILTFLVDFQITNQPPLWLSVFLAASFTGITITIFFINYTEFQKYGFLPLIAICGYEIYHHFMADSYQNIVEAFYYFSLIFIALYFTLRVKKKKYQSKRK
jgi:FtsH-binding integral membrane protein